jgi:AraC-like DNA-binding protein
MDGRRPGRRGRGLEDGVRAPLHRTRGRAAHGFATDWLLSLAADLLLEPDATIGSVAYQVGYTTPHALSTAFKRVRSVSPRQHRLAAAAT